MSSVRGYSVGRGRKGIARRGVKREVCPRCGKRGLSQWRPLKVSGIGPTLARDCRYCNHVESRRIEQDRTMKATKVYEWYLVVEGAGSFPFDMLGYDSAHPVEQEDAAKLEHHHHERRRVAVCRRGVNESPGEHSRWRSFGWVVVLWTKDKSEALQVRSESPGSIPVEGRS